MQLVLPPLSISCAVECMSKSLIYLFVRKYWKTNSKLQHLESSNANTLKMKVQKMAVTTM